MWKSGKPGDRRSRRGYRRTRKRIARASSFREERSNCTRQTDGPSKTRVSMDLFFIITEYNSFIRNWTDLNAKLFDCRKRRQKRDKHFDGRSICARRRILWSLRLATVRRENGCNAHDGGHWRWILSCRKLFRMLLKINCCTILLFLLRSKSLSSVCFRFFQKFNRFRRRINLLGESRV